MSDDLTTVIMHDGPAREEAPGYAVPEQCCWNKWGGNPRCTKPATHRARVRSPHYLWFACEQHRQDGDVRLPAPRIDWPRALGTDVRGAVRRLRRDQ